jgi:hypothetical protein
MEEKMLEILENIAQSFFAEGSGNIVIFEQDFGKVVEAILSLSPAESGEEQPTITDEEIEKAAKKYSNNILLDEGQSQRRLWYKSDFVDGVRWAINRMRDGKIPAKDHNLNT